MTYYPYPDARKNMFCHTKNCQNRSVSVGEIFCEKCSEQRKRYNSIYKNFVSDLKNAGLEWFDGPYDDKSLFRLLDILNKINDLKKEIEKTHKLRGFL